MTTSCLVPNYQFPKANMYGSASEAYHACDFSCALTQHRGCYPSCGKDIRPVTNYGYRDSLPVDIRYLLQQEKQSSEVKRKSSKRKHEEKTPQKARPLAIDPNKDYTKPLSVDCSVEYDLPRIIRPPPNAEPLLKVAPRIVVPQTQRGYGSYIPMKSDLYDYSRVTRSMAQRMVLVPTQSNQMELHRVHKEAKRVSRRQTSVIQTPKSQIPVPPLWRADNSLAVHGQNMKESVMNYNSFPMADTTPVLDRLQAPPCQCPNCVAQLPTARIPTTQWGYMPGGKQWSPMPGNSPSFIMDRQPTIYTPVLPNCVSVKENLSEVQPSAKRQRTDLAFNYYDQNKWNSSMILGFKALTAAVMH